MCDTLGVLFDGHSLFGKNSDRSPNEAQVTEFYPARVCKETSLSATYVAIPQARETKAVLLSRPVWMWGAEIGVNEAGVAIGNEAVFTKGLTASPRSRHGSAAARAGAFESAESAVNTIIELLETYGQGGNCGLTIRFITTTRFS
jgi:dipeptidase